jgi:ABC-type uncharacterized transport system ATPase subunit
VAVVAVQRLLDPEDVVLGEALDDAPRVLGAEPAGDVACHAPPLVEVDEDVERVADRVALIDRGRVVFSGALDHIKDTHHRLTLRFPEPRPQPPALAGALAWEGAGAEWVATCNGALDELTDAAAACGARVVGRRAPSLDEIFVARVGAKE